MRCTVKKHFEVAVEAGVAMIVQVKDNQAGLRQRIQEIAATTAPLRSAHSHDAGRNRDETRTVTVFHPTDKLADTDWHPHVAAIIRVERQVFAHNAKTGLLRHATETAFYYMSLYFGGGAEVGSRITAPARSSQDRYRAALVGIDGLLELIAIP